jgi:hypothetical protein
LIAKDAFWGTDPYSSDDPWNCLNASLFQKRLIRRPGLNPTDRWRRYFRLLCSGELSERSREIIKAWSIRESRSLVCELLLSLSQMGFNIAGEHAPTEMPCLVCENLD